jgi:hypothetical protein
MLCLGAPELAVLNPDIPRAFLSTQDKCWNILYVWDQ